MVMKVTPIVYASAPRFEEPDPAKRELEAACSELNACLGTLSYPSGRYFWSGNQSSSDEGLYRLWRGSKMITSSTTVEGLLAKVRRALDEMRKSEEPGTSWVEGYLESL